MVSVAISVVPEPLAIGLRTQFRAWGFDVVMDPRAADVLVSDDVDVDTATPLLWVVAEPPQPSELAGAFLGGAPSGVILLERAPSDWAVAVRSVAAGGTWIDPSGAIRGDLLLAALRGSRWRGPHGITSQELRVVRMRPDHRTNAEIGRALGVSANTVKTSLSSVLRKLSAPDRTQAVERAQRLGLLE